MIMRLNLPVLFLSNALYPMASLPTWMRVGAMANPTSYLINGLRQTVLAGSDELPLWLCLAVTSCFAAAVEGSAALVVTHDPRLAERADRVLTLVDGRIVSDVRA
jgi:ABC-type multidrug transport system permease subunit